MQRVEGRFIYAASDLNNYLECKRLTELDALVVRGKLDRPADDDPSRELIQRKGEEHEQRYLERLHARHDDGVVVFGRADAGIESYRQAEAETLAAMRAGARIIYQATFFDGTFIGHADFLRRIEEPSDLGSWSYEVIDTKLALAPKAYFLVQLCNYSEHLQRLQGRMPDYGFVVLGNGDEQRFRLNDYLAYYRHLKSRFLEFVKDGASIEADSTTQYPVKCKHCSICPWNEACTQKRVDDDHLSLVAWMRRDQIAKFEVAGIDTLASLARSAEVARPEGMSPETFAKLRRQASLQLRGRDGAPLYELLRHAAPMGFGLLPEPSPGDVFFDMEGDPLYEPGRGLEYLFGCWLPDDPRFRAFWGVDRAQEKIAFEEFVDFIVVRRRRYPTLHIYHYAPYEKTALRRLAQQHCTREEEIDDLLRGEVLVDLYAVVRQALAISEERYSIKNLERFYELHRSTEVKKGNDSIVMFERWLLERDEAVLADIEAYNKDDCCSTFLLRQWLLERRSEAIELHGLDLPFRALKAPDEPCHPDFIEGCKTCDTRRKDASEELRRSDLERELLRGVLTPETEDEYRRMAPDRRSRYLLANLLAYHRREEKPEWWAFFDRCENIDDLLEFDKDALAGLQLQEHIAPYKLGSRDRNLVYTYAFPDQKHKIAPGSAHDPRTQKSAGEIVELDDESNSVRIKRSGDVENARALKELIPKPPLPSKTQRAALQRIAQAFVDGRLESDHRATLDLLTARNPHVRGFATLQPDSVSPESVSAVVQALDRSYLFIQGPPGSGKSTAGSHVICDLLALGKRIGVMSTGHKAIHNLLHKVEYCMDRRGKSFRGFYKHSNVNPDSEHKSRYGLIQSEDSNELLDAGGYDLVAGTSWAFAREALVETLDYLFIDEAGQVSLADALAVSSSARNIVLLGDPSQLAQVSQGKHPLHADDSVLQHLLGEDATVSKKRGIFLDISYRMQPEICAFASDAVYEGRLQPAPATRLHRVVAGGESRSGLLYLPIEHNGNSSESTEEADRIVREIALLREGSVVDSHPEGLALERPMRDSDIIVVSPYNAQRRIIARKLKEAGIDVRVGTVDKFQGQEAAVVFYSMATSSGDDIPRDVEFLFERNRFNVAISRARALSVLVCSPRLLDIACRTPEEMGLANLLCAFAESANGRLLGPLR